MADTNLPPIPASLKIFEVNDITSYAKQYDDSYSECVKVFLFIDDDNIYWLGKIFNEERGIILSIIDIHDTDFTIHDDLSIKDFERVLSVVLDRDIEDCSSLENITCSSIKDAEQLFNTKMLGSNPEFISKERT